MAYEIRLSVMSPDVGVQTESGDVLPPGMGVPPPTSSSAANRLDTLENKTVYLVDTGYGGSYNFMLQLQKWFAEHMPSVTLYASGNRAVCSWTITTNSGTKLRKKEMPPSSGWPADRAV